MSHFYSPFGDAGMKLMFGMTESDDRINIKKILHGKSTSISATISLVNIGALGPEVSTGSPVIGSVIIRVTNLR